MDVIEARTDPTSELDIQQQWRLIKSDNEREVFRRVTIQEVGEDNNHTVDIWIMRGEKTLGALAKNTFHVGSEHDGNSIDWNNTLFRYKLCYVTINLQVNKTWLFQLNKPRNRVLYPDCREDQQMPETELQVDSRPQGEEPDHLQGDQRWELERLEGLGRL